MWRGRAASAAALVLSEKVTLRFFRAVAERAADVLAAGDGARDTAAAEEARREAARAVRDEGAAVGDVARKAKRARRDEDGALDEPLAELRERADAAHAATVVLAYLQIRWRGLIR